jgi:tetratricopeptide (TPR) repeat protein
MNVEIFIQSECLLVEKVEGASDVYIYFAPVLTPANIYIGKNVLKDCFAHRIYINDQSNQWYLDGIPGYGNFTDLVEFLRELTKNLVGDKGKVITFGGSMGGFGAIAFGCAINADVAIGQGVEFVLNIPGGASKGHLKSRNIDFDIFSIMRNSNTIIFNYTGEGSITDLYCAVQAKKSGANIINYSVKGLLHALPKYINENYGISRIIKSAAKGYFYHLNEKDEGDIFDYSEEIIVCCNLYCSVIQNNVDDSSLKEIYNILEHKVLPSNVESMLHYHLAFAYYKINLSTESLLHSEKALLLQPNLLYNLAVRIKSLEKYGSLRSIGEHINLFLNIQDHKVFLNDLDATYCCAKFLAYEEKNYIGALELCKQIIKIVPNHDVAWKLIEYITEKLLISFKENDKQLLIDIFDKFK